MCEPCAAGSFQPDKGATNCEPCERGSYCPEGSSSPRPCEGGTYSSATGATSDAACEQLLFTEDAIPPFGTRVDFECLVDVELPAGPDPEEPTG